MPTADNAAQPEFPWERHPSESPQAYAAFCIYRDLGLRRSLAATAGFYFLETGDDTHGRTGVTPSRRRQLARWSSEHRWVDRVTAWDEEQDRELRLRRIEAVREAERSHQEAARKLVTKGLAALEKLAVKSVDQARLLIVEGAKLERLALGEPVDPGGFPRPFGGTRGEVGAAAAGDEYAVAQRLMASGDLLELAEQLAEQLAAAEDETDHHEQEPTA